MALLPVRHSTEMGVAAEVMDAGVKMFPESPTMMKAKELVIDASKKSKSSGAMDKLKGLGYVGDDNP